MPTLNQDALGEAAAKLLGGEYDEDVFVSLSRDRATWLVDHWFDETRAIIYSVEFDPVARGVFKLRSTRLIGVGWSFNALNWN